MERKTEISLKPIDVAALSDWVWTPESGAVVSFLGIVRNQNNGRVVLSVEYSAYLEMAEKELAVIVQEAGERWPVLKCAAVHRLGKLIVGDTAVAIVVSASHRREAFEACQFVMDNIKAKVPIWKREQLEGSTRWVVLEKGDESLRC